MSKTKVTVTLPPEPRARRTDVDETHVPAIGRLWLAMRSSTASEKRSTQLRRGFPIRAYVGPNGGGKSLCMVQDVLPSLDAGRQVLSTVRLVGPDGLDHPAYIPFTDFGQLLEAEHCDVLMDEIVGIANARDTSKLPTPVQNVLVQLRRRDLTLSWSAPAWARSDKIIREVSQAVTECRGYFPAPIRADDDGRDRMWAAKRVFRFRTYDTVDFEEWTAGKRDKIKPVGSQWFRGPGSRAFATYDTLDSVSMVEGGDPNVCDICGKKKHTEYCKGHHSALLKSA